MNDEYQSMAANAIAHAAQMAGIAVQDAVAQWERPSTIYRPSLSIDGNKWCALYGENLQDGIVGFGDSPADAMWDFDRAWTAKLPGSETHGGAA